MELHPFGCSMIVVFVIHIAAAIWALVVASRIRDRAPNAAALLSATAIVDLVWRAIYCLRMAIYDAGLEVLIDVIAVLDLLERGIVIVLAAKAVQAAVTKAS